MECWKADSGWSKMRQKLDIRHFLLLYLSLTQNIQLKKDVKLWWAPKIIEPKLQCDKSKELFFLRSWDIFIFQYLRRHVIVLPLECPHLWVNKGGRKTEAQFHWKPYWTWTDYFLSDIPDHSVSNFVWQGHPCPCTGVRCYQPSQLALFWSHTGGACGTDIFLTTTKVSKQVFFCPNISRGFSMNIYAILKMFFFLGVIKRF